MANTIKVRSNRDDSRVALWEQHPDHPNGEVFVAGENIVEVAETPRVKRLLAEERLVKVSAADAKAAEKDAK